MKYVIMWGNMEKGRGEGDMATKRRKSILTYSITPGAKRALELTALHYKCTKNQVLDCALYNFINDFVEQPELDDILKDFSKPLDIVRW